MKCSICDRNFNIKRKISTLFNNRIENVCDKCFKKYPIKIDFTIVPLTNYNLKIFTLFPRPYLINENSFIKEYSRVFEYLCKNNNNSPIFIYNNLKVTERLIENLEIISSVEKKDVYILCRSLI